MNLKTNVILAAVIAIPIGTTSPLGASLAALGDSADQKIAQLSSRFDQRMPQPPAVLSTTGLQASKSGSPLAGGLLVSQKTEKASKLSYSDDPVKSKIDGIISEAGRWAAKGVRIGAIAGLCLGFLAVPIIPFFVGGFNWVGTLAVFAGLVPFGLTGALLGAATGAFIGALLGTFAGIFKK